MDAWERQPDESDAAWEAFRIYRDLGSTRSQDQVAKELHKDPALMGRWSSRHSWLARVAEFDRYVDAQSVQTQLEQVLEMRKRHAGLGRQLQALGLEALQQLRAAVQTGQHRPLTATEITRLVETGAKLELIGLTGEELPSELEAPATGRTLGQMFELPEPGEGETVVTELTVARMLVERSRTTGNGQRG